MQRTYRPLDDRRFRRTALWWLCTAVLTIVARAIVAGIYPDAPRWVNDVGVLVTSLALTTFACFFGGSIGWRTRDRQLQPPIDD